MKKGRINRRKKRKLKEIKDVTPSKGKSFEGLGLFEKVLITKACDSFKEANYEGL